MTALSPFTRFRPLAQTATLLGLFAVAVTIAGVRLVVALTHLLVLGCAVPRRDRPVRPPVVLLHGGRGTLGEWAPVGSGGGGAGYAIHAFELPGHGMAAEVPIVPSAADLAEVVAAGMRFAAAIPGAVLRWIDGIR